MTYFHQQDPTSQRLQSPWWLRTNHSQQQSVGGISESNHNKGFFSVCCYFLNIILRGWGMDGKSEDNLWELVLSLLRVGSGISGLAARALTYWSISLALCVFFIMVKICLCVVLGILVKITTHEDNNNSLLVIPMLPCLNPLGVSSWIFLFVFLCFNSLTLCLSVPHL